MRFPLLSLALLLLLVCLPSVATGQVRDEPKGMTFESTLPPAISKEQEQQWLVFLMEELNAGYHKKWETEEISGYFVAMLLELCMHDEAAIRAAATTFYNADWGIVESRCRCNTLFLALTVLLDWIEDSSITVLDGKLSFKEHYYPMIGGTGASLNPFEASRHPNDYDHLKSRLGLRDLRPFVKQRFSDSARMLKWKTFAAKASSPDPRTF